MDSLSRIVKILKIFPKGFFFDDFVKSTWKELKEECDYETEADK